MPCLITTAGAGPGQRHELRGERTTIGRDPTNHIQIADPKSSRVHAEVIVEGGRYQVRDLDSSNGTWLGDGRISSLPLIHGSEFRIGATRFRFESMNATSESWSDPAQIQALDQAKTVLFTPALGHDVQALARANTYLVLLHHLIHRSNAAPNREALFELLDDAAAEALEGDRCAVFIPSADGDGWVLWPAHERRLRARFGVVPFARTLLTAIRARGEPLLCTKEGDLSPSASMVQSGVQSAMAAPVRIGDDVQALLYVDRLVAGQPFTRTDLEFLSAVANQMAVHLANRATVAALQEQVQRLQQPLLPAVQMIGDDPAMVEARAQAERLAQVTLPVLIIAEPGCGKELLARFIHGHSPRAARPFQVITCANLDDQGAEGMLFGRRQEHGLTTPGVFELADGGTVYFDELSDLPLALQARLLRLLEAGEVQRPGEATLHRVDVRIIAASSHHLADAQTRGQVRADLVHALAGKQLELPPLRQRLGDVEALAEFFLGQQAALHQQPIKRLTPEAKAALLRHGWPGNVRELRQVVERAGVLSADHQLHLSDLPEGIRTGVPTAVTSPIVSLTTIERAHILRVLEHCGGNKKAAAELLEIDRSTLYAKLKQYGMG